MQACAIAVASVFTVTVVLAVVFVLGIRSLLQEDGIIEIGTVIFLAVAVIGTGVATTLWGTRLLLALEG